MKKLTVNEQEELFAQDCKLINLRYEYSGFTGTEKWAIVTELSEEALWDKYPDIISRYMPFILLSMAQGEVISESHRNDDKYEKRSKRTIDMYGYEDDVFEQFHPKSITPFIDPFDKAEEEVSPPFYISKSATAFCIGSLILSFAMMISILSTGQPMSFQTVQAPPARSSFSYKAMISSGENTVSMLCRTNSP